MKLVVLKRSRKRPQVGDVFVWQLEGEPYRFGRVVRTGIPMGGFREPLILVYLYKIPSHEPAPVPPLALDDLVVPPMLVHTDSWSYDGVFMTVGHQELREQDMLPQHCFADPTSVFAPYVDESGHRLKKKVEPCGLYAVPAVDGIAYDFARGLGYDVKSESKKRLKEAQAFRKKLTKIARQAEELSEPRLPAFKQVLRELLDELGRIGRRHEELYDTIVREEMAEALLRAFVFDETDHTLPDDVGLDSRRTNAAVRRALQRYIDTARELARQHGLTMPA